VITTLAPLTPATAKMESNTLQSPVITETNAVSDLVMLFSDANIPLKYVTIITHAQLILAQMETVFSLLLFAKLNHARPLLVTPTLENAFTLLLTVMTTMLAQLMLAILTLVNALTLQLFVPMQTNAQPKLAIQ
jgi:hypothetical protein